MAAPEQAQGTTQAPNPNLVAARPAETLTIVGALAFLIARALGVDNDTTMTALTTVIAFIPAAVTWLVQVFSRTGSTTAPTADASVSTELKNLNKTVADALASRTESGRSTASATELVDAVDLVLAARAKSNATNTAPDAAAAPKKGNSDLAGAVEDFREDFVQVLRDIAKAITASAERPRRG